MLNPSEISPETLRPLRRVEYEEMVRLGMFEGERVELLYGTIVQMSPHGPPYDATVGEIDERLKAALGRRAIVRIQSAFAASDGSEPEPDVAVVPRCDYWHEHPSEAWLIVEVADSSLAKDRGPKARLYAESGVLEYWVVNLIDALIEVHRSPSAGAYGQVISCRPGDVIRPLQFPDIELSVADLLRG